MPFRVYAFALDADDCVMNRIYASLFTSDSEPCIFNVNLKLFLPIIQEIKEGKFDIVELEIFSNRQSFLIDYVKSKGKPPYFFDLIYNIHAELAKQLSGVKVVVRGLLTADIDNDLEAGTSLTRGRQVSFMLGKNGIEPKILASDKYNPNPRYIEGTKFNILYPQVHDLAERYPSKEGHFVLYHAIDDHPLILEGIKITFSEQTGRLLLPAKMKMKLSFYNGLEDPTVFFNCVGEGEADPYFRFTTKAILNVIRAEKYKAWERSLDSKKPPNFMLLPDKELAHDLLEWRLSNHSLHTRTALELYTLLPLKIPEKTVNSPEASLVLRI